MNVMRILNELSLILSQKGRFLIIRQKIKQDPKIGILLFLPIQIKLCRTSFCLEDACPAKMALRSTSFCVDAFLL
jgi:hypothetical protein